jgi:hypothetical protein
MCSMKYDSECRISYKMMEKNVLGRSLVIRVVGGHDENECVKSFKMMEKKV